MTSLVKRNSFLTPTFGNFFSIQDLEKNLNSVFDWHFNANPLKTSIYKGDISFASDIKVSDKELVMLFELPAIDQKTLDISVDNNVLTISAEKPKVADESYSYIRQEITYGKYVRSYTIGSEYDLNTVESSYKNGVLTITIQRKAETLARKVEVKFDNS
jgi:HSP20 family molecular chaperone IbpA